MKRIFLNKVLACVFFVLKVSFCSGQCDFPCTCSSTPANCGNFGSIIVTSPLGASFVYSADGGISYQASSVFNNLTPGNYSIVAQNITNGCTTDPVIIVVFNNPNNTWIGSTDTAWENPVNWSCGIVPDENTPVAVYSGTVIVSSNITVYSLSIGPGVNFVVSPGYTVTVLH